jgi:ABC-type antimicrobial peptide transport system permease subunit
MSWREVFRLAASSLLRRPARTSLTVLGVTLGSALLVALGSIASVAESRAVQHFGKGLPVGAIKVAPEAPAPFQLQSDEFETNGPHAIDDGAVKAMRRLPDVKAVVPIQFSPVLAVPPAGDSFAANMAGTDLSQPDQVPVSILAGRLPRDRSLTEVAVTESYLDRAHPGSAARTAIGEQIEVAEPRSGGADAALRPRWFRATIVGVVSLEQTHAAREWQRSGDLAASGDLSPSPYTGVIVVANDVESVHRVRTAIDGLGYATSSPEHILDAVLRYLHVVDIVLAGIGLIALLVSGLGIANALLSAVRERRREIGVLKAIGATDLQVVRWFLLESALVGLAGGILGTITGGVLAAAVAARVTDYLSAQGIVLEGLGAGDVPVAIVLAGVLGSCLLALLCGALPALRAARLPAREAVVAL